MFLVFCWFCCWFGFLVFVLFFVGFLFLLFVWCFLCFGLFCLVVWFLVVVLFWFWLGGWFFVLGCFWLFWGGVLAVDLLFLVVFADGGIAYLPIFLFYIDMGMYLVCCGVGYNLFISSFLGWLLRWI